MTAFGKNQRTNFIINNKLKSNENKTYFKFIGFGCLGCRM